MTATPRPRQRVLLALAGLAAIAAALTAAEPDMATPAQPAAAATTLNPFNSAYRERLRHLCETYDWAREQRRDILERAQIWLDLSDADLRVAVPSQMVPRALYCNRKAGCPKCGVAIFRHGYYPWRMDPRKHPWKVECPNCSEIFPTNDFEAYYRSGLDERAMFRPERADARLLFNTAHPDPNDPLHTYGVDPGTGWTDPEKGSFKFVAHYNHHANWGANARYPGSVHSIPSAAVGLGYGYAVTGDLAYARKAAVLLDRLAEVYPDLDFEHWASQGGYHQYRGIYGTAVDSTWSTRVAYDLVRAYALVRDAMAEDRAWIEKVERGILRDTFARQKQSMIWGNTGFNKDVVIMMIQATTDDAFRDELVAWLFSNAVGEPIPSRHSDWRRTRPGGGLGRTVANLSGDGFSWEGGFGYSAILPMFLMNAYRSIADLAEGRTEPEVRTTLDLLRQRLPRFFHGSYELVGAGRYMPGWADGGRFATPMIPKGAQEATLLAAYAAFEDDHLGRLYWRMTAETALPRGDLLDPRLDYERLRAGLERLRDDGKAPRRASCNLAGRGFAILRSGEDDLERTLITYYGSNSGHNHLDTLTLFLFAYGHDLMPGLGYPDLSNTTWRQGFWEKPISHNTVATEWSTGPADLGLARQALFVTSPLAALTQIEADRLYPNLRRYGRLPVLVSVSDEAFYVLDVFRIGGGTEHVYSFHSGVGEVTVEGAEMVPQDGGSYAGPEVPFAARLEGEGWKIGSGRQFFRNVRRAAVTAPVTAAWRLAPAPGTDPAAPPVGLRFTLLSPPGEVALATSQPPQNIPGNPEDLPYLLARATTTPEQDIAYTAVIEPYQERRALADVRRLAPWDGTGPDVAIEVRLADGRRDVILQPADEATLLEVEGGLRFRGTLLLARFSPDGTLAEVLAVRPSTVTIGTAYQRDFVPFVEARVKAFDRGAPRSCTITLDRPISIPDAALRPLWTAITTAPDANGNYPVQGLAERDGGTVLDLGDTSFISGFDEDRQAYTYAFEEGARLEIPLTYHEKVTAP